MNGFLERSMCFGLIGAIFESVPGSRPVDASVIIEERDEAKTLQIDVFVEVLCIKNSFDQGTCG